ncbi:unnamed protein product [Clonostachys rosea]|uniref:Zn(2)-C6 fungal-type domain-containing protein n=1 Tax=Bionectria ochroleuca TaxID=29856 RepID=A0ABY6UAG3_BIOOC|nr:unnamed protein product [Clonostachys rosea]
MTENSRRGRKIARRACDLCRDRRIQCTFPDESATACRRCLQAGVSCTFLTERKPRGPPSRHVVQARQRAEAIQMARQSPHPLPIGHITVAQFLPEPVFLAVLDDYLHRVYPLLPYIHVPTFTSRLAARDFERDQLFFQLCLALCAATIASIPRTLDSYGITSYSDTGEMVDRASNLVLVSRLTLGANWMDRPSVDSIIISLLLAMASHYAGRSIAGWAYTSEASHCFREMELYKEEAYEKLNKIEAELHDRMSYIVPHTGLAYDPKLTSWEFLLPLELSDEQLLHPAAISTSTPVISGFVALIQVFTCMVDLLDTAFPGAPSYFRLTSSSLSSRIFADAIQEPQRSIGFSDDHILDPLVLVMARLDGTLRKIPDVLKLPSPGSPPLSLLMGPQKAEQFEIMRANIHITSIYVQSMTLEMCLSKLEGRRPPSSSAQETEFDPQNNGIIEQLCKMRESVAQELLSIVNVSAPAILEANGNSMIKKIREIAATFLDQEVTQEGGISDMERRNREYLAKFAEVLAKVDYTTAPRSLSHEG